MSSSITFYNPADHTAEEWDAMAKGSAQDEADSFERSDTDGFLSQWASRASSTMYRHMARIARNGNRAEMRWLFEKNEAGDWVPVEEWRWIDGRYGQVILIPGESYGKGRFFNPSVAKDPVKRNAANEKKGFRFGVVEVEVVSRFTGGMAPRPYNERKKGAPLTVIADSVIDED